MVQYKPTPEEQLLKLIEGGGSSAQGAPASSSRKDSGKSKGMAVLGQMPGFLDYFRKFSFGKGKGMTWNAGALLEVRNLNKLLMAFVASAAVFLVVDLILFSPDKSNFLAQVSTSDAVYPVRAGAADRISSDISAYKIAAQKRNPFLPPQAVVLPGAVNSGGGVPSASLPAGATGTLAEALQGIKLVGISWSENPLALIEDVTTGRTFFLRKGQEVKGIKVQAISQEKVAVTYQGQEGELF